jgi:hypothetical protein
LRIDGIGRVHRPLLEGLPPFGDVVLDVLAKPAVLLASQLRDEGSQGLLTIADEAYLHRVADREHSPVDVDLHAARLALGGKKFRVRKVRPDHEQGIAVVHHLPARLSAQEANGTRNEREVIGERGLAQQRLRDAGAEKLSNLDDFVSRMQRTGTDQYRDLIPGVEHVRCTLEVSRGGDDARGRVSDTRVDSPVLAWWLLHRIELLHIVWHHDTGHSTLCLRDPQRSIDQVPHLRRRRHHVHILMCHVLEQRGEVHLLLIIAPERGAPLLADDRNHRLVVQLRIVETVEQMNGAGTGGREADPDFPRKLRMAASHEGRHLVSNLDKLDLILGARQGAHDAVDAIARVTIDPMDPPLIKPLYHKIANRLSHGNTSITLHL